MMTSLSVGEYWHTCSPPQTVNELITSPHHQRPAVSALHRLAGMRQVLVSALLCAVALTGSAVMDGGRSGLRWEVRESDGSVVRVLTDSERLITLEYNNRSQLIQCWDSKEGSTADAVSLMFYSVIRLQYRMWCQSACTMPDATHLLFQAMADQHTVSEKQAVTIDLDAVMANCSQYLSDVSLW